MTATRITDRDFYEENDDLLGFDWGGLTQAGIGIGLPLVAGLTQKGPKDPCREHPTECLDALITQYNADMNSARQQGATPAHLAEIVAAYSQMIDDPSIERSDYWRNTKRQFEEKIASLRAMPQTATGQPALGGQIVSGVSNSTLLLGAALVGVFLMMRQK